ncbi:lipoyl(octanoyl) transferase LipB [Flavobacteriaceae bacterium]|nr:lipoyl(octanoyl) transferase LipB [Flavobacteriaceae bacterium]
MNIKNKKVAVIDLGHSPYKEALTIQEKLFNHIISLKRKNRTNGKHQLTNNYLLWVEHAPVFTLGKSGKSEHLLLDKKGLKEKGIEYFASNRGGDITYHGPGQIVGYPIFDLDNFFTDIHKHLRFLEQAVINTLSEYDIKASISKGETGVWLDAETPFARKICALGVRASRWVTMHGFALNVTTDLSYFDHIIPCGIQGKGVTSMEKELGKKIPMKEVQDKLKHHLALLFDASFINTTL